MPAITRAPAVAGTFYPATPEALRAQVDALLAAAPVAPALACPKALIVPHAGYVYSGPIAARGFARLAPFACGPLVASAQDSPSPLQVKRIGLGDVAGMKGPIGASVEACRAAKQLPPGPVPLPSDAQLAKLVVHEEEEFFDGGRWASYRTQRGVRADPQSARLPLDGLRPPGCGD